MKNKIKLIIGVAAITLATVKRKFYLWRVRPARSALFSVYGDRGLVNSFQLHAIDSAILKKGGIAILALMLATASLKAQTVTNIASSISTNETTTDHIIDLLSGSKTNLAFEAYGTIAPKAPTKIGGGAALEYNFTDYVGGMVALDWLGSFNLVSGSVTLQAPFHLTKILPFQIATNSALASAMLTPYVRGGIATAYSGGGHFNGAATVDTAMGVYIKFGHLWGGQFVSGGEIAKWQGAGPYDVTRYHIFFGWSLRI